MTDFLDTLAADAKETVDSGYYEHPNSSRQTKSSLLSSILQGHKVPVISEVKSASPSKGIIRREFSPEKISQAMARGGAAGISVLTEPKHFCGSLRNLARVRESVLLPLLMKDIIISPMQLDAAVKAGANAVLLIQAIFDRGHCQYSVSEMIAKAHSNNLEVLLETHTKAEFQEAMASEADIVGINNRNLGTLQTDLNTTRIILSELQSDCKVVVSESGINTIEDLRFLHKCGAKAFLIGSSIMLSNDVEAKVKEFVNMQQTKS
jgi:indole-3-glycerol phosphate synthase